MVAGRPPWTWKLTASLAGCRHRTHPVGERSVRPTDEHYGVAGACSQARMRTEVAPAWADHMAAGEVDAALLVTT